MPTKVRITVNGKLALTVEQAADRYCLAASSMRGELTRLGPAVAPAAMLDGRKPLYLAADLDTAMSARPGRGRRRPSATGAARRPDAAL